MGRWRVTYLPNSSSNPRDAVATTIDDPESESFEVFVTRLSNGSLGVEWNQGRVIQSVEATTNYDVRRRESRNTAIVFVVVAVGVVLSVSLLWISPITLLDRHPWSGTEYTGASCGEGCFGQPLTENFPNGSLVAGAWSAPQPVVLFIATTLAHYCPGGSPSSYGQDGGCSEPGESSGSFSFTASGGPVYFTFGSESPENVSVSGSWSSDEL